MDVLETSSRSIASGRGSIMRSAVAQVGITLELTNPRGGENSRLTFIRKTGSFKGLVEVRTLRERSSLQRDRAGPQKYARIEHASMKVQSTICDEPRSVGPQREMTTQITKHKFTDYSTLHYCGVIVCTITVFDDSPNHPRLPLAVIMNLDEVSTTRLKGNNKRLSFIVLPRTS